MAEGAMPITLVGGQPGIAADIVSKVLADAGHDVRTVIDGTDHAPTGARAIVMVEPRAADWRVVDDVEAGGVVVFTLGTPDAATIAHALRRGTRAIVDGAARVDDLVRAVELAGDERVVLTAPQVDRLLHALDAGLDAAADDAPRLSRRESQILAGVASGESAKQTARALGISEKTVEHLQHRLHIKLGVRTRAQAVTRAHALGLLRHTGRGVWSTGRSGAPRRPGARGPT
jgi:DNA-binding NarL/FixJ family response regulator